jgi:CHAD domain-containing protein
MAFQLKPNERTGEGVTRNVRRQIEKAIEYLAGKRAAGVAANDAVFEARKCFKKVRAALRLVREELGNDLYHETNWRFRDAARPLTRLRDAQILVETANKLRQQLVRAIGPGAFAKIRQALLASQEEVNRSVQEEAKALATVQQAATRELEKLAEWKLQGDGWERLEAGLRRVYRTGHRALALAEANLTVANLHELRKQVKYLWHELQLLELTLAEADKALIGQTHALATMLGEDHDLAVLRETLAADPLAYGGHHLLKNAFAVIDKRRQELQRQAFTLAREIYKDPPKVFAGRIGACMQHVEVR